MKQKQIQSILSKLEQDVINAPRRTILDGRGWANDITSCAGVYAIWEFEVPVYVGETKNLKKRMKSLSRPRTHTFTKKCGETFDINEADIGALRRAISERYMVSFVLVPFGRKEGEEYLIEKWRKTVINKP